MEQLSRAPAPAGIGEGFGSPQTKAPLDQRTQRDFASSAADRKALETAVPQFARRVAKWRRAMKQAIVFLAMRELISARVAHWLLNRLGLRDA